MENLQLVGSGPSIEGDVGEAIYKAWLEAGHTKEELESLSALGAPIVMHLDQQLDYFFSSLAYNRRVMYVLQMIMLLPHMLKTLVSEGKAMDIAQILKESGAAYSSSTRMSTEDILNEKR